MVCKVDETGILEAFKDSLCSLGAFGWGTVEEEREVYELRK